jgi:hypothetical protein
MFAAAADTYGEEHLAAALDQNVNVVHGRTGKTEHIEEGCAANKARTTNLRLSDVPLAALDQLQCRKRDALL